MILSDRKDVIGCREELRVLAKKLYDRGYLDATHEKDYDPMNTTELEELMKYVLRGIQ